MHRITRVCGLVLPTMVLSLAVSMKAQETQQPQKQQNTTKTRSDDYSVTRPTKREISALEKENLSRVAAAPSQIKEVLVKEPGLLVELKRWIAKDASNIRTKSVKNGVVRQIFVVYNLAVIACVFSDPALQFHQ